MEVPSRGPRDRKRVWVGGAGRGWAQARSPTRRPGSLAPHHPPIPCIHLLPPRPVWEGEGGRARRVTPGLSHGQEKPRQPEEPGGKEKLGGGEAGPGVAGESMEEQRTAQNDLRPGPGGAREESGRPRGRTKLGEKTENSPVLDTPGGARHHKGSPMTPPLSAGPGKQVQGGADSSPRPPSEPAQLPSETHRGLCWGREGEGAGRAPVPESPVTAACLVSGGWHSGWSVCKHARLLGTCLWGEEESGPAMPPSAQALGGQGSQVSLGGF